MHFELSTKGSDEQGETEGIGEKRMVSGYGRGIPGVSTVESRFFVLKFALSKSGPGYTLGTRK